jgi:hypothetical protein
MNTQAHSRPTRHPGTKFLRRLPITAVVTSLALAVPCLVPAAEAGSPEGDPNNTSGNSEHASVGNPAATTVADLQAENARLKQALEAARQQLAREKGATSAKTGAAPVENALAGAVPPIESATILASGLAPADTDASAEARWRRGEVGRSHHQQRQGSASRIGRRRWNS